MICGKCKEELTSSSMLTHYRKFHPGEKDLNITCPECSSHFSTLPSFQKHWYSKHHVSKQSKQSLMPSTATASECTSDTVEERGAESDFYEPPGKKVCVSSGVQDDALLGKVLSTDESDSVKNTLKGFVKCDLERDFVHASNIVDVSETTDSSEEKMYSDQGSFGKGAVVGDKLNQVLATGSPQAININAASFVLKLQEMSNSSSFALAQILNDTEDLIENSLQELSSDICEKLKEKNIQLTEVLNIKDLIKSKSSVFQNIKSEYQQKKYFQEKLGVVQPLRIPLGREFKRLRRKGQSTLSTVAVVEELMYVPIIKIIDKLIHHTDYQYFVENGAMEGNSHFLDCYMKGKSSERNSVLQEHPDALRLVLYYDDLEVCAPLKSRAGRQKLGAFYLYLDNIPPKFRSNLNMICLAALVNANYIKDKKYGIDSALEYIIKDLEKLEKGVILPSGKKVFGTLIAFIGDNLGLHAIGGFKEGFTAYRCCRFCCVTYESLGTVTKEDEALLRDKQSHNDQCSRVQTDRGKSEALSKEFGINRSSILNQLESFHVVGGLPPDVMHDILEGVLPLTVKNFLRYILYGVQVSKLTLDWLNKAIRDFDFDYAEMSDKPSELKKEFIVSDNSASLHQSASQMWLLARILPLILGQFFDADDQHYNNLLDCLEICRIVFTSNITKWMTVYLQDSIEVYLTDFVALYGRLIPKQHHLVHYPRLILELGSLVNYSCMRCEAKHKYFKNLVNILGNYKNIPFTLSVRHQMSQGVAWSKSLRKSQECGPQTTSSVNDAKLASLLPPDTKVIILTKWLSFEGIKYIPGRCFICVGVDENSLPIFAKIVKIIIQPSLIFVCEKVETLKRDILLASYQINVLPDLCIHKPEDLCIYHVMHAHTVKNSLFISVRCCAGDSIF